MRRRRHPELEALLEEVLILEANATARVSLVRNANGSFDDVAYYRGVTAGIRECRALVAALIDELGS